VLCDDVPVLRYNCNVGSGELKVARFNGKVNIISAKIAASSILALLSIDAIAAAQTSACDRTTGKGCLYFDRPTTLGAGQIDANTDYIEKLRRDADERLERMRLETEARIQRLLETPPLTAKPVTRPPAIAYWNEATHQMFVGDRAFNKDDHAAAKQTWGSYNTKKPEGPGWIALPESSYTSYMAVVNGHKEPGQSGSEAIYRNCVIEKSTNQPESVVREIRATCRDISSNPSLIERWKWGE
jgi:hypothetical protein